MTQQDTQPPAETLAERDVARQHAHALLDDALFRCSQGKAKADFIEALHKHDQEQGLSYDGIVELCQTWVWAIIAQGPAAALTRRAGGDAIPAGALPQHIGRVHLGKRRSDGERMCSHGHEVSAGHPLYWPEQISQYDDSDPLCLAHAIEQLECDNADWNTPKPPADGDAGAVVRAVTAEMRRFMPNACGDWADKIDAAMLTEKARKVAFYDEPGHDIQPGETLPDRDRRIYQQGRHDALNDEPEAFI